MTRLKTSHIPPASYLNKLSPSLDRYYKDKEIWEKIFKKAKLEFYEKIEAKA